MNSIIDIIIPLKEQQFNYSAHQFSGIIKAINNSINAPNNLDFKISLIM